MTDEFTFDFSGEAAATNVDLAGDIARLSPLTEDEVNALLPNRADQDRLKELIRVVKEATDRNVKLTALTENIGAVGNVVLTIVEKYLNVATPL